MLAIDVIGRRFAQFRQADRGAVVRQVFADGGHARLLGGRGGGKRAVADLQFDDLLALGLQPLGRRQHIESRLHSHVACELAVSDRHIFT